jgi:hypothetical protein
LEMAQEVLERQASSLAARKGQTFEVAMQHVADTEAGRQLRELRDGPHRDERAAEWQEGLIGERARERLGHFLGPDVHLPYAIERHYSWLEAYMKWLEGEEARTQYHTLLEEELASLRG